MENINYTNFNQPVLWQNSWQQPYSNYQQNYNQKPDEFVKSTNEKENSKAKKNTPLIITSILAAGAIITSFALLAKQGKLNKIITNSQDALSKLQKGHEDTLQKMLFPSGLNNLHIMQQNVGDCYLLSSLYSLSTSKKGQEAIRKMITVNADGDFLVKLNAQAQPILVKGSELLGQNNIAGQTFQKSANSDMGVKIIERAYGKYRKTLQSPVNLNNSMTAIQGGFSGEAIQNLVGYKKIDSIGNYYDSLLQNKQDGAKIKNLFDKYSNTDDYLINIATQAKGNYSKTRKAGIYDQAGKLIKTSSETHKYTDPNHIFFSQHAYSVKSVDKANGIVEVINPHDTSKIYKVSYDDIAKYFGIIEVNKVI